MDYGEIVRQLQELPSYYVLVFGKDEKEYIAKCLDSVLAQTHKPALVIMHDDGSTDGTLSIMYQYVDKFLDAGIIAFVKNTGNTDRDFGHVPKIYNDNWNHGRNFDFILILAADCALEPDYAKRILQACKFDEKIAVASGDSPPAPAVAPHGSGRFIRMSWFFDTYKEGRCTESIAHESEFNHRADMTGHRAAVIRFAIFEHLRPLGQNHNFFEFGRASACLGYHPLFMLWSGLHTYKRRDMRLRGTLNMLWAYFTFRPAKSGYFTLGAPDLRRYCRKMTRDVAVLSIKRRLGLVSCKKGARP